ncbi:MAG TPA: trypsin-like peptidase domain-containing protein, partial [Actinomycetota bacterium]|nr:trypsin-like peptidase domain-containing protein [Actinomycetota bacterium]
PPYSPRYPAQPPASPESPEPLKVPGQRMPPWAKGVVAALAVALVVLIVADALGAFRSSTTTLLPSSADAGLRTASRKPAAGTAPTLDIRAALRAVEPGVVEIVTSSTGKGLGSTAANSVSEEEGTGMVLDAQGNILTNAHLVSGAATIEVQLFTSAAIYNARVLGVDVADDVAVVKIDNPPALTPVPMGHSSGANIGDPVVTVGNALGLDPGGPSVTSGLISGLDRSVASTSPAGSDLRLTRMIQTDAAINPGDSGGPLVDASNHVIGMDTFLSSAANGAPAQDIGFAIPIDSITPLISSLEKGIVPTVKQGFLGVNVFDAQTGGAQVQTVVPGSPAELAGLQPGDIIVGVNGQAVANGGDLGDLISAIAPGKKITLRYVRNGSVKTATLTLTLKPTASPS